jgi:putative addiction module component (TIGR02574 family)
MRDQLKDLVERGRALPPDERERLVDELLASLNQPAAGELAQAWEAEIERRLARYDRGEVQSIEAEEVFARARRLAARR